MKKISFSDIKFNDQNEPLYRDKKIQKWWGKAFYRVDEKTKTIEYKNLTAFQRFLHHFFSYAKDYHRINLKTLLDSKKINPASKTKSDAKVASTRHSITPQNSPRPTSEKKPLSVPVNSLPQSIDNGKKPEESLTANPAPEEQPAATAKFSAQRDTKSIEQKLQQQDASAIDLEELIQNRGSIDLTVLTNFLESIKNNSAKDAIIVTKYQVDSGQTNALDYLVQKGVIHSWNVTDQSLKFIIACKEEHVPKSKQISYNDGQIVFNQWRSKELIKKYPDAKKHSIDNPESTEPKPQQADNPESTEPEPQQADDAKPTEERFIQSEDLIRNRGSINLTVLNTLIEAIKNAPQNKACILTKYNLNSGPQMSKLVKDALDYLVKSNVIHAWNVTDRSLQFTIARKKEDFNENDKGEYGDKTHVLKQWRSRKLIEKYPNSADQVQNEI